jgi:hypothetical protein
MEDIHWLEQNMKKCIWCLGNVVKDNIEHIIPEALGCPDRFHLVGCVCELCNNSLGHLDQAVVDDFDIPAFMAGVRRKKGRMPQVFNRGNFVAKHTDEGPTFLINMERNEVHGKHNTHLARFGASKRNIRASFDVNGKFANIKFSTKIGESPKFVRGIYKIAFSSLAYFIGADEAVNQKYSQIRDFVRKGEGTRKIIMISPEDTQYRNQVWPPYRSIATGEYAIGFRLSMIEFIVDLTPNMTLFPSLLSQLRNADTLNWSYLPVDEVDTES